MYYVYMKKKVTYQIISNLYDHNHGNHLIFKMLLEWFPGKSHGNFINNIIMSNDCIYSNKSYIKLCNEVIWLN